MKAFIRLASGVLLLSLPVLAQRWEVGGVAGYGFYNDASVKSPAGDGNVGFKPGPAFGAIIGNNMYNLIGGELRYEYRMNDLKLTSGREVTFGGQSHALHYDFLVHFAPRGSKIRPFVSAGGGVKIYRGTGTERADQPLQLIALLTRTNETKGMGVFGAGIKIQVAPGISIRAEVKDFLTPFPRQVIAPSIGAKISGWSNDIVPMIGIVFLF